MDDDDFGGFEVSCLDDFALKFNYFQLFYGHLQHFVKYVTISSCFQAAETYEFGNGEKQTTSPAIAWAAFPTGIDRITVKIVIFNSCPYVFTVKISALKGVYNKIMHNKRIASSQNFSIRIFLSNYFGKLRFSKLNFIEE